MKKILLYSLGATFLTMVVSALFVFGVFNTSSGAANLIGAEIGVLHGSGEIEIHNQIVRNIHDIGNKTKEIIAMIDIAGNAEESGEITDEAAIKSLASAGEDLQKKLENLNEIFDGNSFSKDKQIVKDTFLNDYKPAVDELSYMLIKLKGEPVEIAETPEEETEPVEQTPLAPITADKKTEIKNSCAKLIEAHNTFSDVLNQKRRY